MIQSVKLLVVASLLLCLSISAGYAQNRAVDSLRQLLVDYPEEDTTKLHLLTQLTYAYSVISPTLAEKYGSQALDLAQALQISEQEAKAYQVCGVAFARSGKYERALSCYFQSLKLYEEQGLADKAISDIHNIAGIYFFQGEYLKALEYAKRALTYQQASKDSEKIADGYQSLGLIYQGLKSYGDALLYYQKALLKYRELGNKNREGSTLLNMGSLLRVQGDSQAAIENYSQALEIYRKSSNLLGVADLHGHIGDTYREMDKYELADQYLKKAKSLAHSGEFIRQEQDIHLFQARLDSSRRRFEDAFHHYQRYINIRDSLYDKESDERLEKVKAQFELYQKDQEVELLQKEAALHTAELEVKEATIRKQQWVVISASLLLTFLAIGISFLIYTNRRQQKAQWEIEQSRAELASLNTSKDHWFSIISHDFRSPLTFLQSALSLINQGNLSANETHMLTIELESRVKQTSTLLDNLLYWSQSQLKDIQPNPRKVDIQALVKATQSFYQPHLERKGVSLDIKIDKAYQLTTDREMLNLIFRNLISNAIVFSPTDGTIVITGEEKDGKLCFSIADEGPAIPKEHIPKLFSTHNPTEAISTRNQKGMGLGLWLSRYFLEKNGGEIWVRSDKEKGAIFFFNLPL